MLQFFRNILLPKTVSYRFSSCDFHGCIEERTLRYSRTVIEELITENTKLSEVNKQFTEKNKKLLKERQCFAIK